MSEAVDSLRRVVELMVDRPQELEILEHQGRDATVLQLSVAEDDLGKVIGRQGRTARALRTLLAAREERGDDRYDLDILD